jgi:hypothetical protein
VNFFLGLFIGALVGLPLAVLLKRRTDQIRALEEVLELRTQQVDDTLAVIRTYSSVFESQASRHRNHLRSTSKPN